MLEGANRFTEMIDSSLTRNFRQFYFVNAIEFTIEKTVPKENLNVKTSIKYS